jgi:hypothetical protein
MNFDHIFILTYGRSGSTLLQGILNSIDGVLIRGENSAALRLLFLSWRELNAARAKFSPGSDQVTSPWYGIGDVDCDGYGHDLVASFIRNVLKPSATTKIAGFKEIRYSAPELDGEIEFMRTFFSRPAFIINTRDMEATLRSTAAAKHAVSQERLVALDKKLGEIAARGDPDVFHVHYDDYKSDMDKLKPLFGFLGAQFNEQQLQAAMDKRYSVSSGLASTSDQMSG